MADTARDLLEDGLNILAARRPQWTELDSYHRGTHPRPFAPPGITDEYKALQEMAVAPWLRLVVRTPVQRLRLDGFRMDTKAETDAAFWSGVWVGNSLTSRQNQVYTDGLVHGRGIVGVWPNAKDTARPAVVPESPSRVFVAPNPDNPFESLWAVKAWSSKLPADGRSTYDADPDSAVVYTPDAAYRFRRTGKEWRAELNVRNVLAAVPFVEFTPEVDSSGRYHSMIEPLVPMQRAIDTARFDLLMALQFSAARQRGVTGFDPVIRDEAGQPVWKKDAAGNQILDREGNPIPQMAKMGRPGVDRLLMFPGADTKVWDLPESNLKNYTEVISMLVQQLAAISQVPPQYLLGGMANLSGDALTAAESTLASLVKDLQDSFGAAWSQVAALAGRASGRGIESTPTDPVWGDGQARSFAATVDGIVKLVNAGFPLRGALEMLPGATDAKVSRWMDMARDEVDDPVLARILGKDLGDGGSGPDDGGAAVPATEEALGGGGSAG